MSPEEVAALTVFPARDLIGYGKDRPHPHWPNDAKIAVNFVINYEEFVDSHLRSLAVTKLILLSFAEVPRTRSTMEMQVASPCCKKPVQSVLSVRLAASRHTTDIQLQMNPLQGERDIPMETQVSLLASPSACLITWLVIDAVF
jgi:hypothetical protein